MSFLQGVGVFGFAALLAVILWFGTKDNEGGKLGPLPWGWIVGLALLAGAAFQAVDGFPFNIITALLNDLLGIIGVAIPELTLASLGLILIAVLAFRKNSRRGVAMLCIFLVFVGSDAGGPLEEITTRITTIATKLPA
ncbi:membrane protein [Streptomyces phage TurkishDelight]|uniref:Membrane protein n=1 Tax=Streptomyces phage TurkishDelight TaxID=2793708 RepID=A0A7T0M144_9CAUD|nr:membrane protein [Streptomyces phage TurkishDelight]QPL14128.1 membrane protein [Streptomyces phage TurkishDelight]